MEIIQTKHYLRQAKSTLTIAERQRAVSQIAFDPLAWPMIQGTGGARKARISRAGRGKSGGARVIYFYAPSPDHLFLLTCYAKSRQSDLSAGQKKVLAATVREIKESMKEIR